MCLSGPKPPKPPEPVAPPPPPAPAPEPSKLDLAPRKAAINRRRNSKSLRAGFVRGPAGGGLSITGK